MSFAAIESEGILARKIRIFKNASRAHYNTRRLITQQHLTYKRSVSIFFAEIAEPVAHDCGMWLCHESDSESVNTDNLLTQLHTNVAKFEKAICLF